MSLITTMAGVYITSNAIKYISNNVNKIVIDTAIHNSVNSTLNNLFTILNHTKKLDHIDFNNLMSELDIVFKLDLIKGFLSDINTRINYMEKKYEQCEDNQTDIILYNKQNQINEISNIYISNSLILGLKYLDQSLNNFHKIIDDIKLKIEYHQTKYFNYFRVLDLNLDINKIKLEHQILISRFDLILKTYVIL